MSTEDAVPRKGAGEGRPRREERATFFGTAYHKVSPRKQVAIPRQFMRTLETCDEGQLLLLRWVNEEFLRLYTKRRFDEVMAGVKARVARAENMTREERRNWIRKLTGVVEYIEPDSQGRFVLPNRFADLFGGEAAFCGVDNRIEIWPAEMRRQFEADREPEKDAATVDDLTEILDG